MKRILLAALFLFSANVLFAQIVKNPVNWSSSVKKIGDKTYQVILVADIDQGWHMYSQSTPEGGPIPTKVTITKNPLIVTEGSFKEKGKMEQKFEPLFGVDVKQYSDKVEYSQVIKTKANINTSMEVAVQFMVCDDHQCLPPSTKKLTVALNK